MPKLPNATDLVTFGIILSTVSGCKWRIFKWTIVTFISFS
jgi:hypothetical protein